MNNLATITEPNDSIPQNATFDQLGLDQEQLPEDFNPSCIAMDSCGTWFVFSSTISCRDGIWSTEQNRADQFLEISEAITNDNQHFSTVVPEDSLIMIVPQPRVKGVRK